ncbi:MAG: diacylglycerol kinase family enzyme [Myxococcota bacterium]|jgi:diacylglycerol kinase family enzyme
MLPSSSYTLPDARIAVLLNANAGQVSRSLAAQLSAIVPPDRVFLTQSALHSRDILRQCVADEISTVFAGGGDGTVVGVINDLNECHRQQAPTLPNVGVLRLGTGNAMARWLGSGRPAADLRRWQDGQIHRIVPLDMVESEETIFPFAGMGHDAALLNDYNRLKSSARGKWWASLASGMPGYVLTGALTTLPRLLRHPATRIQVINTGSPAHRCDVNGREIGEAIPTGGVIYEGPSTFVGTATTPLYGYGMRMFPHATRRAGRFQLRIADLSPFEIATNLPATWRGTISHPRVHDFYADRIRVRCDDAMPYQLAGEACGYRQEMTFGVTRAPVNLIAQG